jgi:hypothetical protein
MAGRPPLTGGALVLLALALLVAPTPSLALYTKTGDVVILTSDTFDEMACTRNPSTPSQPLQPSNPNT